MRTGHAKTESHLRKPHGGGDGKAKIWRGVAEVKKKDNDRTKLTYSKVELAFRRTFLVGMRPAVS